MLMVEKYKVFEKFENGDGYNSPVITIDSKTGSLYATLDFQIYRIGAVEDSLETLEDRAYEAYMVLMGYHPD